MVGIIQPVQLAAAGQNNPQGEICSSLITEHTTQHVSVFQPTGNSNERKAVNKPAIGRL